MNFRFLDVPFNEYDSCIHHGPDKKLITIEGVKCILKIHEDHPDYCEHFLELSKGTMLVYEIDDKESFEDIKKCYYKKIKKLKNKTSLLVGNKLDLESERKVTRNETEEFANENELSFLKVRAKNIVNVK